MTMYCFYQTEDKSPWVPALATERQNVIRDIKPKLITVLDVDNSFQDEEIDKDALRYIGPMYFDLDGDEDEREEVINAAKELANAFIAKGANPNMFRIFLSGKKGLHFEIPQQIFVAKIPPQGIKFLPAIYKEMAFNFKIPFVDMRVYSAGRGRQWRCENVQRENGKYKVQITLAELFELTPEKYDQLCAAPRMALPVEPPVYNPNIALLYSMATEKVEKAKEKVKKRKASGGTEGERLVKKFGGEWPETVKNILNGVIVDPDAGWNRISLQLAITAATLGKSEGDLLEAAQGLFESHKSDSHRYSTPRKRRRDLRDMFNYVSGNDAFEFSVGGLLSIVRQDCRANHDLALDGYEAPSDDGYEAPSDEGTPSAAPAEGAGGTTEGTGSPAAQPQKHIEETTHATLRFDRRGIHALVEADRFVKVCDLGIANPTIIRKIDDDLVGYYVDVFEWTKSGCKSRQLKLPTNALLSRAALNAWTMDAGGYSMRGTDANVLLLADLLRQKASETDRVKYSIGREGVDVIIPPGAKTDEVDIVWVSTKNVVVNGSTQYVFNPAHVDKDGVADSDLMQAGDLVPDDAVYFDKLLNVNSDQTVAKILGWMVAAFYCQHIRYDMQQFPILQIYGQSGSGKTTLVELFSRMHYNVKTPRILGAAGQTLFPLYVAVATSASVPVVFDETKGREMTKTHRDSIMNLLRQSYNGTGVQRGSIGKDKAVKEPTVISYGTAAPIAFIGESIESQSAIMDRCVIVAMSKTDKVGRRNHVEELKPMRGVLGKFGRQIALTALATSPKDVGNLVRKNIKRIEASYSDNEQALDDAARPIFNMAVVMAGLELCDRAMRPVFGEMFSARLAAFQDVLVENIGMHIPKNMSEAARVLDAMANLSRHSDPQFKLVEGTDYTIDSRNNTIDIKLIPAYHKYVKHHRGLGLEVLYDNEDAFVAGMSAYGGVVKRFCPDNQALFDSARAKIFRFDLKYMEGEGVDSFGVV